MSRSGVPYFQVGVLGSTVQIIVCLSYCSGIVEAHIGVLNDYDELRPQLTHSRQ